MHRLYDGFDHLATANLTMKWTALTGSASVQSSVVRNGAGALSINTGSNLSYTNPGGGQATVIMGFGFRTAAIPSSPRYLANFLDAGTNQLGLRINADGTLSIYRGQSVLLGSSVSAISAGTWYWVEFKALINNSTGTAEVRVNGVSWIALTGQDTQQTANATANRFNLEGSSLTTFYFDDFYCGDGASPASDFLGDSRIVTVIASSGDGTLADFTPSSGTDNGAMVDDATPDGDTTYNASATAGHRDSYNFAALGVSGTVHGLQLNNIVRKSDAGARTVNGFARIGSTNYDGTNVVGPSDASYSDVREIWETSPATASAWTVSEIDGAEFGLEVAT